MAGATIKLFLVHGDAKRLRTAELSLWTGKAVAGPRSELDGVLAREEAIKSGVYFLSGFDSESGKPAVYVGEAENIRERLRGHLDRDFWNHVVFFVSKDENLTKAHIRYLEGRLIEQAKQGQHIGRLCHEFSTPPHKVRIQQVSLHFASDLPRTPLASSSICSPLQCLPSADQFLECGLVEGRDAEAPGVVVLAPRVFADDDVVGLLAHR